ncbi:pyruvate dehydrogenase E2 component (dihydrolipoamide acetyltransferase) [Roseibium hamelinense]|uniref:Pyruvate dehydrogenase E2 component (Dihydrolipoamide acetyltransferase) n=1 Tax=Roseibium hamelinense TaxID=150831 RepID=A0A562SF47_9HYPH|nr:alpha/beta fold hydrolase [Roseibium hamelinense]MTI42870.1 alpha/beta fold hydrolase [Roseibium hamelinense]TWI79902.1 pyruvate dehydrogenase E2 component (dihydrolipoamide acetyltransferase) [Roseibium hamelinense]
MTNLRPSSPKHLPFSAQEGPAGGNAGVIVFLHGFGGDRQTWVNLQTALASKVQSLAFDLPGHGEALDWPVVGNAGIAAKAVLQSIEAMGLSKVNLVGHSMGGAVAALIALRAPEKVGSLTLLAPGGFGPEINQKLLRRYAAATDPSEMEMLLEQFFGWEFKLPKFLAKTTAEARSRPGAVATLEAIAEEIIDGDVQKTLPRKELAELPLPVKVIWGTQDRVLPTRQAHKLPGVVATHIFERVGHMPHLEIPQEVTRLIRQNIGLPS